MRVVELRRRLISRIERIVAEGDEDETALVLSYARAILVALARNGPDDEVSLQEAAIGTDTAALILGLHREYVRALVRHGRLSATKSNGELQIPLAEIAEHISHISEERSAPHLGHKSRSWWREMTYEVKLRQ